MSEYRIALFTVECAQTGAAMAEIVARHPEVRMIVTSDVTRPARGSAAQQAVQHIRRSGLGFAGYLLSSFQFYNAWLSFDRVRSAVTRGERDRLSVAELCAQNGLRHIHSQNVNGADVIEAMRAEGIDLIVIYWFDQILKQRVIDLPAHGVVNLHAAPLPVCRGLWPVLFSAIENDRKFGITAHLIEDERIDAGPIIGQLSVADTGRSVLYQDDIVNRSGTELLSAVLADLPSAIAAGRHQSGGSYFSHPERAQIAAGSRRGISLTALRDMVDVYRSKGSLDAEFTVVPGVPADTDPVAGR